MYLRQLLLGSMDNFAYIAANPFERIGTVIDPGRHGKEAEKVLEEADRDGVRIKYIISTHSHYDHIGGINDIAEQTGAELLVHEDEKDYMDRLGHHVDIILKDNDLLNLGGLAVRIIHTPGHSPGSICILSENKLFTGDTLFVGGCGRADLPGSEPEKLYHSLYDKILSLPDETEIYPGHDYGKRPVSTIAAEKVANPYLQCGSLDEFLKLRMER